MWEATDPDGRRLLLSQERWSHVVEEHDELREERDAILEGLKRPAARRPGRHPNEEWFYVAGPGPTHFVKVVVHYDEGEGLIVTAFPRRRFP